ncbi:YbgA family protein [Providencia sp. Je.9.19]|uniref:YbgA family protein n=1 Tax=Providencia sp. Je.9.19 TaxID=3142844 RepID=UPI003DA9DDE9
MQLIKQKIILLGEINFPSEQVQQLTASFFELVPQDISVVGNEFDGVGIICSSGVYEQQRVSFPENMPILIDDEWQSPEHLDRFLIQIHTLLRLAQLSLHLTHHEIIQFHSRYKYLIMAYSPKGYQLTGKSVANISSKRNELSQLNNFLIEYKTQLMTILSQTPARNIQINALSHIQGYFKHKATKDEKKHLLCLIDEYREGNISLNLPLAMLRQLLNQYPDNYLSAQYYFEPYPNCEQVRELPYF